MSAFPHVSFLFLDPQPFLAATLVRLGRRCLPQERPARRRVFFNRILFFWSGALWLSAMMTVSLSSRPQPFEARLSKRTTPSGGFSLSGLTPSISLSGLAFRGSHPRGVSSLSGLAFRGSHPQGFQAFRG